MSLSDKRFFFGTKKHNPISELVITESDIKQAVKELKEEFEKITQGYNGWIKFKEKIDKIFGEDLI